MKVADFLTDYLIKMGVTDVFGIPGGVILDFVYALNRIYQLQYQKLMPTLFLRCS